MDGMIPPLSALSSIEHYNAVKEKDTEVKSYFRLFLLPGVLHCGGGDGPSQADWIAIIRDWVENNNAPEQVIVSKSEKGKKIMSRPVFPNIQVKQYMTERAIRIKKAVLNSGRNIKIKSESKVIINCNPSQSASLIFYIS